MDLPSRPAKACNAASHLEAESFTGRRNAQARSRDKCSFGRGVVVFGRLGAVMLICTTLGALLAIASDVEAQSLAEDLKAADAKRAADAAAGISGDPIPLNPAPEHPEDKAKKAFGNPPQARRLSMSSRVWVDPKRQRVYVDGYVTMVRGPLEMFACPVGSKEHESIVAVLANSIDVHTALLAVGAQPGTPVQFRPIFVPPTGQEIRLWVCWRDAAGKFQTADVRRWIRKEGGEETLRDNFVFAGSSFWTDPEDGREYYQADGGDLVCVSNFASAMLDVPLNSSASADQLVFTPFTDRIPERGTPVRLVFVPIPQPTDTPPAEPKILHKVRPEEDVLPPFAEESAPAVRGEPESPATDGTASPEEKLSALAPDTSSSTPGNLVEVGGTEDDTPPGK